MYETEYPTTKLNLFHMTNKALLKSKYSTGHITAKSLINECIKT